MRILLAIHNAYTDHTSGAAHSMRIIMQWLAEAGHDVRVLATARFDARPPGDLLQGRAEAEERFAEPVMRRRYLKYFASIGPAEQLFE